VALIALAPVARVPGAGSLPMPAYPRSAEIGDGSAVISGHRGRGSTMACNCIHRVHGPPTLSVGPPGFLPCQLSRRGFWIGWLGCRPPSRAPGPGRFSSPLISVEVQASSTARTGQETPKSQRPKRRLLERSLLLPHHHPRLDILERDRNVLVLRTRSVILE
jgi:hypothetical protein